MAARVTVAKPMAGWVRGNSAAGQRLRAASARLRRSGARVMRPRVAAKLS